LAVGLAGDEGQGEGGDQGQYEHAGGEEGHEPDPIGESGGFPARDVDGTGRGRDPDLRVGLPN
ncbi:MAG: hypothetical protein ACKPGK_09865, partial [Verrucomicrobiota bacterium]